MFVTPGGRATTGASAATRIWFCAAVSTLYIGFVITAVAGTAITIGAGDGVGLCAWMATAIKAVVIASAISFVFMVIGSREAKCQPRLLRVSRESIRLALRDLSGLKSRQ